MFAALDRIEQEVASVRTGSQAARARLAHETDEEVERILARRAGEPTSRGTRR